MTLSKLLSLHAMPLAQNFQWLPKVKTQHDLTLPILALCLLLFSPPFSCSSHTSSVYQLDQDGCCSLGLCARFSLWKGPPCNSTWLPPLPSFKSPQRSPPAHLHLFVLLNFFLSFFDITQLASLFISAVYFPTKSCSMRTLSVLVTTGSHHRACHVMAL